MKNFFVVAVSFAFGAACTHSILDHEIKDAEDNLRIVTEAYVELHNQHEQLWKDYDSLVDGTEYYETTNTVVRKL